MRCERGEHRCPVRARIEQTGQAGRGGTYTSGGIGHFVQGPRSGTESMRPARRKFERIPFARLMSCTVVP